MASSESNRTAEARSAASSQGDNRVSTLHVPVMQATRSAKSGPSTTESMDDLLRCAACTRPFVSPYSTHILTSISCGHSFHSTCVELLNETRIYAKVECYEGGCPLPTLQDCIYCWDTVSNSSKADPTTVLVRNLPLEKVVACHAATKQQEDTKPEVVKTKGEKRAVTFSEDLPPPSQSAVSVKNYKPRLAKRVKFSEPILEEGADEEGQNVAGSGSKPGRPVPEPQDIDETHQLHPSSPLPDSDPEDEDRTLQQLYMASQALAAVPYTEATTHQPLDEAAIEDSEMQVEQELEEAGMGNIVGRETGPSELPLDEYGMPPLSQFRRSLVASG